MHKLILFILLSISFSTHATTPPIKDCNRAYSIGKLIWADREQNVDIQATLNKYPEWLDVIKLSHSLPVDKISDFTFAAAINTSCRDGVSIESKLITYVSQ